VRIASALLALLLTLPMTGWLLLPFCRAGAAAQPASDTCAQVCAMAAMHHGKVCPMMQQMRRDQACSCQISGVPRTLALDPVHAVPPQAPASFFSFGPVSGRVLVPSASSPIAGFPGSIDHPPSHTC
jgi:hypothetical protein